MPPAPRGSAPRRSPVAAKLALAAAIVGGTLAACAHFTKAGARKLAHYVDRELRRLMAPGVTAEEVRDLREWFDHRFAG